MLYLGDSCAFLRLIIEKVLFLLVFIIENVCLRNDDAERGDALLFILMKSKAASAYSHDLAG